MPTSLRLLAFSDIHNNMGAVRKLRAQETNGYDGILVAGDIGSESVGEIQAILSSFDCPVFLVFGNWDAKASYGGPFLERIRLVHHTADDLAGYAITGFSGCPAHWGQNPVYAEMTAELKRRHQDVLAEYEVVRTATISELSALTAQTNEKLAAAIEALDRRTKDRRKRAYRDAVQAHQYMASLVIKAEDDRGGALRDSVRGGAAYRRYVEGRRAVAKAVATENRRLLDEMLRNVGHRRAIVMTHERLYRFADAGAPPLVHVFGHRHQHSHTFSKGTHNVNVAALDDVGAVSAVDDEDDIYSANLGGYCVFTLRPEGVEVERRRLQVDASKWKPTGFYERWRPYLPEERRYTLKETPIIGGP